MHYRPLGNTDIEVSVICLGTMTFGEQNSEAEGHAQLDLAWEQGVNFIDTAEMYPVPPRAETYGQTEAIVGSWIKNRNKRDDVIIATKIAGPTSSYHTSPPPLAWIRGGETRFQARFIEEAVDASLKRLHCDYIDLYQLHWPDRNANFFGSPNYSHQDDEQITPLLETLTALQTQVQAGKIRYVGLSNETPWGLSECLRLAEQHGLPRMMSVQNPYNLLNRIYEIGMAEISVREQCGLLPYSPLAFGVLTGKYRHGAMPAGSRLATFPSYKRYTSEKANAAVEAYVAVAEQYNLNFAQMSIAFTIQQPFVTSSIIGATTLGQLETNLAAADLSTNNEWTEALNQVGAQHFNPCP